MAYESHSPRLSQGMVIDAEVEAWLLGIRLLDLRAEITALPAVRRRTAAPPRTAHGDQPEVARSAPARSAPAREHRHSSNGGPGGDLADAARSLASVAADLKAARGQMPD